jgi:predicted ArsR family transcriptional regulator
VVEVLQCLKKYGQRLDLEIAEEIGVPLAAVRRGLEDLSAAGSIIKCNQIRYENGKATESWVCRVSGYVPPLAAGRKAKAPV